MNRIYPAISLALILGSLVFAQENRLKAFEGEWEGTVKYLNPAGREIGKAKARRILRLVSPDTLKGTLEFQPEQGKGQLLTLVLAQHGGGYTLIRNGRTLEGKLDGKTFNFTGRDEGLNSEMLESHFFVAPDQEFFTVEHVDPKAKKKMVHSRGVLRLKKN